MTEESRCIHCGICTRHCDFLKKYQIDLAEFANRPDLAYHCFLCGDCAAQCPKQLDGRQIALDLRASLQKAGHTPKAHRMLILEKSKYLFQNYQQAHARSILFPGCNFPSFYPETTKKLIDLLWEKAGIGVAFDCCGKPIAELGICEGKEKILASLRQKFRTAGVQELVVLCPNCYYFLRENLDIPVLSIYDKLQQLGLGYPLFCEELPLFVPCPDKKTGEIKASFLPFLRGSVQEIKEISCCGLGGAAALVEPALAEGFALKLKEKQLPAIYTYCASCAGNLNRAGCSPVRHILVELLREHESLPKGVQSLVNRAKFKFYKFHTSN